METVDKETISRLEGHVIKHVQVTEKRSAILEKLYEETEPQQYPQRKAEQFIKEALEIYLQSGNLNLGMIGKDGKSFTSGNADSCLKRAQQLGVRQDLLQCYAQAIINSDDVLISFRDKITAAKYLQKPQEELEKLQLRYVYAHFMGHPPDLSPQGVPEFPQHTLAAIARNAYNDRMERGTMEDHYGSALLAQKYLGTEEKQKAIIQLLVDPALVLYQEFEHDFFSEKDSVIQELELSSSEEYSLALRIFEGALYNCRITEQFVKNLLEKYAFSNEEKQTAARIVERFWIERGEFRTALKFRKVNGELLPKEIIPQSDLELLCKYC